MVVDRFMEKVAMEPHTGCWLWAGAHDRKSGYGKFGLNGKTVQAHRMSYALFVGPLVDGLVVDHRVCDTTACVNPAHLAQVTQAENLARVNTRRSHCKYGHALVEGNVYPRKHGGRQCKRCTIDAVTRRRRIARDAVATPQ